MYFHLYKEGRKVELAANLCEDFTITEKARRHYANQTASPLLSLCQRTNFMSTLCGLTPVVEHSVC